MDIAIYNINYRPQTKFAKVMFLQESVCPHGGYAWCWGCAWCRGACLVLGGAFVCGAGGHACMVPGGMHGAGGHAWCWGCAWCQGVCVWCQGGCMVAGGHAWYWGGAWGMCGTWAACVMWGGMCGAREHVGCWGGLAWWQGLGSCVGYDEIRSMSGRYASYWNAFFY